jgi:hypothetical protein
VRLSFLGCFVLLLAIPPLARANNNYFLPGDAFFHALVTSEEMEAIATGEGDELTLEYDRHPGSEGAFCGYAGYKNLTLGDITPGKRKALKLAHRYLRTQQGRIVRESPKMDTELLENGDIRLVPVENPAPPQEQNPISLYVYPKGFDPERYALGLKYNENWAAELKALGVTHDHVRMDPFLTTFSAVETDWRDALRVAPLKVDLPQDVEQSNYGIREPMVLKEDVKFVLFAPTQLPQLFQGEDGWEFVLVEGESVRSMTFDERRRLNAAEILAD